MKIKIILSTFLLVLLLTVGCLKEPETVIVNMEDYHQSEPVVISLFEADSICKVKISSTFAAFSVNNTNQYTVDYAYITNLSSNTNHYLDNCNDNDFWQNTDFFPQIGINYKLSVSLNQETIKLEAFDYVPNICEVTNFRIEYPSNTMRNHIKFQINTDKIETEVAYFEIACYAKTNAFGNIDEFFVTNIKSTNPIITREDYYPSLLLLDAINPKSLLFRLDSGTGLVNIDFLYGSPAASGSPNGWKLHEHTVYVEIRNVSYNYYKFKTSQYKQEYAIDGDILYGLAAPVDVHGNIIGARGVFAGYSIAATFEQDVEERFATNY